MMGVALKGTKNLTIVSTSRQNLRQWPESMRDAVQFGAYVFRDSDKAQVTIIGIGAEMYFAVEAAGQLAEGVLW